MRRGAALIVPLAVLVELGVLLTIPGPHPLVQFPLHGLIALIGMALMRGGERRARVPAAALIVLAVGLSLLEVGERASERRPATESEVRAAVERDAAAVESAFQFLLAGQRARVRDLPLSLLDPTTGREEAFRRLELYRSSHVREELHLTVYLPEGEAVAWTGEPSTLGEHAPRGLPPIGILQHTESESLGTRLLTVWAGPPAQRRPAGQQRYIVSEVLLDAPYDPAAWRRHVAMPAAMRSQVEAEFLDPSGADPSFREFLKAGGDRYWTRGGGAGGGGGAGEVAGGGSALIVPVRTESGDVIAMLTLRPELSATANARVERSETLLRMVLFAAVILTCIVAALSSRRRVISTGASTSARAGWSPHDGSNVDAAEGRGYVASPGAGRAEPATSKASAESFARSRMATLRGDLHHRGAVVEGAALVLLLIGLRLALEPLSTLCSFSSLFDYRWFAFRMPLRLAGSPGDVLLSTLTVLGIAGVFGAALRAATRRWRVAAIVAAAAGCAAIVALSPAWVSNSTLNLARAPLQSPILPRLALSWAHASLFLAAGLVIVSAWPGRGPNRTGIPRWTWILAVWALSSAGSYAILARYAAKVPSTLVETLLAPEVRKSAVDRRERLLKALGDEAEDPKWGTLDISRPQAGERQVFEAWRTGELGRTGTRSALAVLNDEGRVLASFAYGLPDSVFGDALPAQRPAPSEQGAEDVVPYALDVLSLHVPLLRAERPIAYEGRHVGRLAAMVSAEWDNLEFLTLNDPLLRTLGAGHEDPSLDEYFGGAPLFIAYSPTGEVLSPSAEQAAPLSARRLAMRSPGWVRTHFGGNTYRTYLFQTDEGPRAIGYVAPTSISVAAGLIRALISGLPLLLLAMMLTGHMTPAGFKRLFSAQTWGAFFAGSYYRRLLSVVLAASLIPLLLLAGIFRTSIESREREEFRQDGVRAAGTIQRLLEDYVESRRDAETTTLPIGSYNLFWVGRTVHQDIHLFTGSTLVATSRGDPEASGLRTFRLNADVARAMAHNRPPQFLSRLPGSGRGEALVYAPVRLRGSRANGLLAMPLLLQERSLGREGEAVADALLTATFGLGLLLSGIGYLFARRLSIPIGELGRAAERIAEGHLDVRVRPRGRDEIRRLVDAFNGMTTALGEQREDLRRRKDYIEAILLNVTTGVISTTPAGIIRTSNPAASLLLDVPADLTGRNLLEELSRRPELAPLGEAWADAVPGASAVKPREVSILKHGHELRLRTVVLPLAESGGSPEGRIYLVEDVTDVMRSNRLEAWAEMARGIAHEIKNPLTPIQLSAEHLLRVGTQQRDLPADYDRVLRECVETILGQVRALREISSDFSAYARLPELRRQPSDLAQIVRVTTAPYRASPPRGVSVVEEIGSVPTVEADGRVLSRALVNLIENALQAMEGGGGLLRISVDTVRTEGGSWGQVVVEDTGEGMDAETLARIFEPYFSTRDSGIGLGLAIARRGIEEHGGTLTAESVRGKGTRMIIRLPIPQALDGHVPEDQDATGAARTSQGRHVPEGREVSQGARAPEGARPAQDRNVPEGREIPQSAQPPEGQHPSEGEQVLEGDRAAPIDRRDVEGRQTSERHRSSESQSEGGSPTPDPSAPGSSENGRA